MTGFAWIHSPLTPALSGTGGRRGQDCQLQRGHHGQCVAELPHWEEQWKELAWKCVATIAGHHPRAVYSLDWGKGGLVTCRGDGTIRVFREETVKLWSVGQ